MYEKSLKKKFEKKFEKKVQKKVRKKYKLSEGREGRGGEGRGEERREGGREGGELSFQCLRPSTSLMASGNNYHCLDRLIFRTAILWFFNAKTSWWFSKSFSILRECLTPYGTSLAELTIYKAMKQT
jgi:hypothetical protein